MEFKKAERKQAKLRLAITGPAGSGKTFSALLIAAGMGKRIAVIDTENHSAESYEGEPGIPPFDVLMIDPPYTLDKYLNAMRLAIDMKYEVGIIDSITHAWAGEGGLLDKKNALDLSGRGNSYTNWAGITKEQELFKSKLLHFPSHLIVTMRSKQDYVLEVNERGKQVPTKIGMAPIQREGMEYEFSMVLDMDMEHTAKVTKTRIKIFDRKEFVPSKETGEALLDWLQHGKDMEPQGIVKTEAEVQFDEIMERISESAKGDSMAIGNTLMMLTEHKVGDETRWFDEEDLRRFVYEKPEWIFALRTKLDQQKIGLEVKNAL